MRLQDARAYLSRIGWLSMTPRSFQHAVFARSILVTVARGKPIYHLSDPIGGLYGLAQGRMVVEVLPSDDDPIIGDILPPGAWVGESAFITQKTRRVGVRAASDCSLLLLPVADLQNIMENETEAWRWLGVLSVMNFDRAAQVAMNLMVREPQARILAVLVRLSGRMPASAPESETVELDISQEELGRLANVSRTVLGEYLRVLEGRGLVSQSYRKVVVHDTLELARHAGS